MVFGPLVLSILLVLGVVTPVSKVFSLPPLNPKTDYPKVEKQLYSMTLEDKLAQMFIFGFSGTKFNQPIEKRLTKIVPGSLILFSRNISSTKQVLRLNTDLQRHSMKSLGLPFFLMVDQEGGNVARIKTKPALPSALALGTTQNLKISEKSGSVTGDLLATLGFNSNLAPVVDLSNPAKISFLGNRSFGYKANRVGLLAQGFAHGMSLSGVIPTYKHYPGHGGVTQDSHRELPRKLASLEELERSDLWPYKVIAESNDPSMVMVAHVAFPNIDPSGVPATFSKVLITDILKVKYGYRGLIITDDLEMSGADSGGTVGQRAIKAIDAGVDMVMVGWSRKKQYQAFKEVLKAVKNGQISEKRINESVRKILAIKQGLHSSIRKIASVPKLKKRLKDISSNIHQLSRDVARQNVARSLKYYPELKGRLGKKKIGFFFSATYSPFRELKRNRNFRPKFVLLKPKLGDIITSYLKKHPKKYGIFYVTGRGTARIANSLSPKIRSRIILINTSYPAAIHNSHLFLASVNVNTRDLFAPKWTADYLVFGNDLVKNEEVSLVD